MNEFDGPGNILWISGIEEFTDRLSGLVGKKDKVFFEKKSVHNDIIDGHADQNSQ